MRNDYDYFRAFAVLFVLLSLLQVTSAIAQAPREKVDQAMIAKIKEEGLKRSQIMESISYLTDVHGPRLTGSPLTRKAGEWTKDRLSGWGLENPHLEPWGPFGRGWTLEAFTAYIVQPSYSPLIAFPKAWSPSTPKAIRGEPIFLDAATEADLDKYRGKLLRAIVLISPPRDVKALFEAPAKRQTDEMLLALANADAASPRGPRSGAPGGPGGPRPSNNNGTPPGPEAPPGPPAPTPAAGGGAPPAADTPARIGPSGRPVGGGAEQRAALQLQNMKWQLVYDEGAAVVLEPGRGDGGTVFVGSATLPRRAGPAGENRETPPEENRRGTPNSNASGRGPKPAWAKDAPEIVPQAVVAVEHYNRILRMLKKGTPVQLEIDILSRYHSEDLTSFNVVAEIPGTDLKEEIVMLGAHFDSWHSGTGATDNAVGCGVALEAVRILQAIGTKPRRTIRIALWTGEEQGLLGSKAYVAEHFGQAVTPPRSDPAAGGEPSNPPVTAAAAGEKSAPTAASASSPIADHVPAKPAADKGAVEGTATATQPPSERPPTRYELKPGHEKLSAYFNLDNGTGKIRGIYLQGNEALRPIFRAWLTPFADLGASTVTQANTFGTDHLSFDGIGLPGFQFIQDPLEYDTRTHHSSMDVFDRIQEEDVKQAAIIMASFVYHAAMRDEKLPRKPLVGEVIPASKPTEKSVSVQQN